MGILGFGRRRVDAREPGDGLVIDKDWGSLLGSVEEQREDEEARSHAAAAGPARPRAAAAAKGAVAGKEDPAASSSDEEESRPRALCRRLSRVVTCLSCSSCFGLTICMLPLLILLSYGKTPENNELVAFLEGAAARNSSVASVCRYSQYNNAPDYLGPKGIGIFRLQSDGQNTRSPNLGLVYHHAGVAVRLVRPDNSTDGFLKLDFSKRGLSMIKRRTMPVLKDVIPWYSGCRIWCGDVAAERRDPRRFAETLRGIASERYNGILFNCYSVARLIWDHFEPQDPGCGPPSWWTTEINSTTKANGGAFATSAPKVGVLPAAVRRL